MALGKKFRKATRLQVKASIMIEGLTGTGKSGLALSIASALASKDSNIYAIDTENQALDLFPGNSMHTGQKFAEINKVDLTAAEGYAPSNYEALKEDAISLGAEVVIYDSYSHAWTRQGGVLDKVSKINSGNNYTAWGDPVVAKEKNLIFELVRDTRAHIITTVRSKEKFAMEYNESKQKNDIVSLGEQQMQQDGLKYEPDLVLRMVSPGNMDGTAPVATVLKSRYAIFTVGVDYEFTKELLEQLASYLAEGTSPEEILAEQHKQYCDMIKAYCTGNKTRTSVWKNIKTSHNFADTNISDIPLEVLRQMYLQLVD